MYLHIYIYDIGLEPSAATGGEHQPLHDACWGEFTTRREMTFAMKEILSSLGFLGLLSFSVKKTVTFEEWDFSICFGVFWKIRSGADVSKFARNIKFLIFLHRRLPLSRSRIWLSAEVSASSGDIVSVLIQKTSSQICLAFQVISRTATESERSIATSSSQTRMQRSTDWILTCPLAISIVWKWGIRSTPATLNL